MLIACICLVISSPLWATEPAQPPAENNEAESFERSRRPAEKKGNILNIILDKAPELSTERGTLIIEAFLDNNSNSLWDDDEQSLKGQVSCVLDDIDYPIPAFIPALDYNARYKLSCQGNNHYQPTLSQKNVLVARRGQIIKLSIPCRSLAD
ncbi:MAG: hypothetical protein J7K75_05730 [Desulfuromonas sp.]|nr:hypothetical protein [Desulfuromonas sp.]